MVTLPVCNAGDVAVIGNGDGTWIRKSQDNQESMLSCDERISYSILNCAGGSNVVKTMKTRSLDNGSSLILQESS